ncbi:MAG: glutathione peroxidase [Aquabacterium sp.]|jgi:glutathione peroxidase|uniref:glutathione peroxidase n=1 Tax=Aquabacterium sp. TaxID=1872578 RepID=UPI002A35F4F4|nr:glutathione peroxidase [Aquabacterium sp.]MDX9843130.1 glutathione peroxidase [Aquabacterium sp.]
MFNTALSLRPWMLSFTLLGFAAAGCVAQAAPAGIAAPASSTCPALLNKTFPRLQDEKPQSLCQYSGQVILVVNTASYCSFTSQYKGLEDLYAKYKGRGLVVLGFPSNDFGQQEPDSGQQIAEFCANTFGVKFPMFAKSSVKGAQANPLFAELAKLSGTTPKWNFYKYLIARDGRTVEAYNSLTAPDSRSLVADIEQALAARP